MADHFDHLAAVSDLVRGLHDLGLRPVLVGGMALVILGSRRVTRDFDFVIVQPSASLPALVDLLYDAGLELVSRLDKAGDVASTIDNRRVAAARLRLDSPATASFFNPATRLRIDLLFDFPISNAILAAQAIRMTIGGQPIDVASEQDLLRLKQIAKAARSAPGDAEDIAFLTALRERSKESQRRDR